MGVSGGTSTKKREERSGIYPFGLTEVAVQDLPWLSLSPCGRGLAREGGGVEPRGRGPEISFS